MQHVDALDLLLVDNETAHIEAIKRAFESGEIKVEIRIACSLGAYREAMCVSAPDVAIVNLNLPTGSLTDFLTLPLGIALFPILVMTSFGNEKAALVAIKEGAFDYIVKSPEAFLLLPHTVERVMREWRMQLDRQRALQTLEATRKLLEDTEAISKTGGWAYDVGTKRISWTREVYRIYGVDSDFDPSDIARAINFYDPQDVPVIEEAFRRAVEVGKPYDLELRLIRANGERVWVRTIGTPIMESGVVERVIGNIRDITERKQTEAQLQLETAALAAAANAILITDCAGVIVQVNPAFTELTGYSAAEAIGYTTGTLLKSGCHDASFYTKLWKTILAGQVWHGEIMNRRKDGSHYLDEQTITPVKDEHGKIINFISIRQDITGKRKIEEHMLRTQRLESVGHLASGLAHDLNNILAPMLIAVPLIRDAVRAPTALKMLDIVEGNARRGSEIIKQLLIFGRGEEGLRRAVKLQSLVQDMENIIDETFPKNIRFQSDAPLEPWSVMGDITQLHQVLMNLCVNARDAMAMGGTLSIGLENVLVDAITARETPGVKTGRHVVLSVTDTGAGIPQKLLDRIFDPFFTTKDLGLGSGLGLSTVMGIVKSHGGVILVKSQPGRGTQFKIYLPALDHSEPAPRPEALDGHNCQGHGELILLVDDEESIRQTTKTMLENNGYLVLVASDGDEGLARFQQNSHYVRVVITDLVMPFVDGQSLIRDLRRISPKVPIVIASGSQRAAAFPEVFEESVQELLPKPFDTESLLRTLNRILHREEQASVSHAAGREKQKTFSESARS